MQGEAGEVLGGLLAPRPADLGLDEARGLARRLYGLDGELQPLRSERDQNLRLHTRSGETFVLKLSHPAEDPEVVDLQLAFLAHLAAADPELPIPAAIATLDGRLCGQAAGPDGRTRIVRLLTWLPGTLLHQVEPGERLLAGLGAAAARLDRAAMGFDHPARPRLQWDLTRFMSLSALLEGLDGDPIRPAVEAVFQAFSDAASPFLPALRGGFIHNDLNPHNLLAEGDRISGILDFGDLVHAPFVCELAVGSAYHAAWGARPLAGIAACVRGYHRQLPLGADEIAILPVLIAARLAMSVLITEWRAREDPENRAYILRNNPASRAGLERLHAYGLDRVAGLLAQACGEADR